MAKLKKSKVKARSVVVSPRKLAQSCSMALTVKPVDEITILRDLLVKIMEANAGRGDKDLRASQKLDLSNSKIEWLKAGGNITQIQVVTNQEVGILANKGIELIDEILAERGDAKTRFVVDDKTLEQWTWREFTYMVQRAILEYWLSKGVTKTEIADHLGLQRTYLARLFREFDL